MYEMLSKIHPDVDEYKIYLAQALYKAGAYAYVDGACQALVTTLHVVSPCALCGHAAACLCSDATKACLRVDNVQYTQRLLMLQAAIKYEEDELVACKTLVDQCLPDDPDTIINYACITYKVLFPHTRVLHPTMPSPHPQLAWCFRRVALRRRAPSLWMPSTPWGTRATSPTTLPSATTASSSMARP